MVWEIILQAAPSLADQFLVPLRWHTRQAFLPEQVLWQQTKFTWQNSEQQDFIPPEFEPKNGQTDGQQTKFGQTAIF